jgi:hypothetical protein
MADWLDALERLQKLKLAGVLTVEEFESEKRKLLGLPEPDSAAVPTSDTLASTSDAYSAPAYEKIEPSSVGKFFLGLVVFLGVVILFVEVSGRLILSNSGVSVAVGDAAVVSSVHARNVSASDPEVDAPLQSSQIERRYTSAYNQCLNGAYTTLEINTCFHAEHERQEARLNQAYVTVMRPLPAAKKAMLRTLQRAWIKQRDAKCRLAGNEFSGGTMATGADLGCLIHETIKRTLYLENYR